MSEYLRSYLPNAMTAFCPNAPESYPYLQQAWDAGDDWDHPDPQTGSEDPVIGSYCFYWNYIGYLPDRRAPFYGPRTPAAGRRESKLLISDYFGYDHWQNPGAYASCEKFDGAAASPGPPVSAAFWNSPHNPSQLAPEKLEITLRAGYTDGHVQSYTAEVVTMKAILWPPLNLPYPDGVGPGRIYLPAESIY